MIGNPRFREKLAVVSHVAHYEWNEQIYAYAPYVREMEIWAHMFDELLIAAPCRKENPHGDCAAFESRNVRVVPQREAGGETFAAKLKLFCEVPAMVWDLTRVFRQADAIHVRCPGNLGLLGSVLAPLFSKHLVAKFAGQWNDAPNDAWSTRFQRTLLRSKWWGSPVTVYGRWPDQPTHIVPFFSAAITDRQIADARRAIQQRSASDLRHVLFVGRLSRAKNVDVLLQALAKVRAQGIPFTATIAGEGPQLSALQQLSAELGLDDFVEFTGGVGFDQIIDLLKRSGVLVLASETEGWPKAIVEAMAFGLVAIGSAVGLVPQILSEGRGFTVPTRDVDTLAETLRGVLKNPDEYSEMRDRAAAWASRYTVESLDTSLRTLLTDRWKISPAVQENGAYANQARHPGVLHIGSFLASQQGTRGISEDISLHLASCGWNALTTSRLSGRISRLADMLSTCWRKRNSYQVAAVDLYSGMAFTWAEAVCSTLRKIGKPYVLTLHGGLLPDFAAQHAVRVRKLLSSATAVTAPSAYLIEQMRPYRSDLILIPNAIDIDSYAYRLRTNAAPKLIWLRAFHELYNPILAVRVLARLTQQFPEAHLTMVGPDKGDGSLRRTRQEIERLGLTTNVTIEGSVQKSQVPEKLAEADIFLNTSGADNTPVSIIEAMACGLCIVSTNVGGIPYLLTHDSDTLLVQPNDIAAMTVAVSRVLTGPDLAQRLSSHARHKALQFDWRAVTPQWDALLRNVSQGLSAGSRQRSSVPDQQSSTPGDEFAQVSSAASRRAL